MSLIHFIVYNIIKKGKKEFDKNNPPDYVLRREQEIQSRAPKNVKVEQIANDGVNGEYLSKGNNPEAKVLMYIHGGGFVGGSPAARRAFTGYTAKKLGYNVYSVDYRLAPEYAFPFGAKDCLKAYKMLVEKYGAKNICLIGESAGGNLVLSVALQAKAQGIDLPACIVVFSPTLQYTRIFPSYKNNAKTDCMLDITFLEEVKSTYLINTDNERNPFAAPLFGDFTDFPPTFIGVSDSEYLYDDSVELNKRLQKFGVKSELMIYHKKMHAFQVIPVLPEAKRALKNAKSFIDKYLMSTEQLHLFPVAQKQPPKT